MDHLEIYFLGVLSLNELFSVVDKDYSVTTGASHTEQIPSL